MSERNLHAKPFDEGTQLKLAIYREYLKEWLPVFLHAKPRLARIQIFDFFAGPGVDANGEKASPVIALEEIHNALAQARKNGIVPPAIDVYFNEFHKGKYDDLVRNIHVHKFFGEANVVFAQKDFPIAFESWYPLMDRPDVANFLFLDQNGVKQVTTEIFSKMTALRRTDFMFYMASSIVNRFKKDAIITAPLPITGEDLARMNGTNVHNIVKEAYERVAAGKYLAPFSIRKGANVYGLIFGTEHLLGLDKFLSICWKIDSVHGLANFDVEKENIDPSAPSLFPEMDRPKKLDLFKDVLLAKVLDRKITSNHGIYEFALRSGFLASHARGALKSLISEGRIPPQKFPLSRDCLKAHPIRILLNGKEAQ